MQRFYGADIVTAMTLDASNNIDLTGPTRSSNFPVTAGAFQVQHAGRPGTLTGILSGTPARRGVDNTDSVNFP